MTTQKLLKTTWLNNTIAFFSGTLLTLAFAPYGIFPLAVLCPAVLLTMWLRVSIKRAAFLGFLFGLGFFGTGVHWIFISMHTFGGMNVPAAVLVTLGFIAILASYFALTGYCLNRFFPKEDLLKVFFAFPVLWLFFEWVRGWFLTGFPWLQLGNSQISSPLKGYAPILGVYGLTLFVLYSAALVYGIASELKQKDYRKVYSHLFAFVLLWAVGSLLSFCHWTKPIGAPLKISLVQGNIPQSLKWSPEEVNPTLSRYMQLTAQHWDSQMIIWPEAAIPVPLQEAQSFVDALDFQAKKHHTSIITGIPVGAPTAGSFYNSVIMIGTGYGIYAKRHLVPFGEYVPFQALFGKVFDLLHVPMSEFISGPYIPKPLTLGTIKIASFICYEIAYPEQVLRASENSNLILTLSNDAWFGHSVAQAQHLEIGQMRALETGRPVIFVSNNGITAFISPDGKIKSIAPAYQTDVLTDTIQPMEGMTPLQRTYLFPLYSLFIMFFIIARRNRSQSSNIPPKDKPWSGNLITKAKALTKKKRKK